MSDCYVAFKACGCAVAAAVIDGSSKRDTAKSVASWIRDGLRIETKPVEWVRENLRFCKCGGLPKHERESRQESFGLDSSAASQDAKGGA